MASKALNLETFFDILRLDSASRKRLFDSAWPLGAVNGEPMLASPALEEKVRDRAFELAELYFALNSGPESLRMITSVGTGKRADYMSQLEYAWSLRNPARRFYSLAKLCEEIQDDVACEIGVILMREESPVPEKRQEYRSAGYKFIKSME